MYEKQKTYDSKQYNYLQNMAKLIEIGAYKKIPQLEAAFDHGDPNLIGGWKEPMATMGLWSDTRSP